MTASVGVGGLTGVIAVAGGYQSGYALRLDGTVWAWGDGSHGALGNGGTSNSAVPVQVSGLASVTAIAVGTQFGYALRADGHVLARGQQPLRRPRRQHHD